MADASAEQGFGQRREQTVGPAAQSGGAAWLRQELLEISAALYPERRPVVVREWSDTVRLGAPRPVGRRHVLLVAAGGDDKKAVLTDHVPANASTAQTPRVWSVAFSRDGATLACGHSFYGRITLWDTTSHRKIATLEDPDDRDGVRSVAFARDGRTLLSVTQSSGRLRFWNLSDRTLTSSITDGLLTPYNIALSPDGNLVAAASGTTAKVWDTTTRKRKGTFTTARDDKLFTLAFGPDNKALVAVSADTEKPHSNAGRRIHVWDVATRKRTHEFRDVITDSDSVSIALSPDGKTLVNVRDENVCSWKLPKLA
ncbi:WD40 repeat domain-containing protein [Streptomyces reniochalinae]|uniref:WD40 repeat domain-containing protein n=1 Tax=Streptomyces reniochalinae TaxID=2250578 RepID=A0A367E761_9ACTN|nr:WD40 repeat domain-containing protein [Streptomyces reniochalinae]RCG13823.1 WD40 repeat domain-containing protein [Streptomyces reniochalinae]